MSASAEEFPQRQTRNLQSLLREAAACLSLSAKNVSVVTAHRVARPPLRSPRVRSSSFSSSVAVDTKPRVNEYTLACLPYKELFLLPTPLWSNRVGIFKARSCNNT